MRHVLIANPSAGKKRSLRTLLERAEAAFEGDYEAYYTEKAGDAKTLALRAMERAEPVRLYACGGDGTLNEVVNAAAGAGFAAVTNIPLGTGNDFLKLFTPGGGKGFWDLAALRDGPQAAFDLIDCNGHLGLDIVCAGLDARVAAGVHRFKRLPLVGGIGAYILSLAATLPSGLARQMRLEIGGTAYEGPVSILCICNGQYYGGGFRPVPEARPDDGVLDSLLIGKVGKMEFLRCVVGYAKGRYKRFPDLVKDFHGAGPVRFSSQEELVAIVDGEALWGKSFTVGLSEKKVNFFYPASMTYCAETAVAAASL